MARIKLHHDIFEHKAGETVDVDASKAKWAVAEGYASTAKDADGVHATSVKADLDPRLAQNADDANVGLRDQIEAGVLTPSDADTDEVVPTLAQPADYHQPELTNRKGNPEKADAGREALEDRAVSDSEKTEPVEDTGTPEDVVEANDKAEEDAVKDDENPNVIAPEETVDPEAVAAADKAKGKTKVV